MSGQEIKGGGVDRGKCQEKKKAQGWAATWVLEYGRFRGRQDWCNGTQGYWTGGGGGEESLEKKKSTTGGRSMKQKLGFVRHQSRREWNCPV